MDNDLANIYADTRAKSLIKKYEVMRIPTEQQNNITTADTLDYLIKTSVDDYDFSKAVFRPRIRLTDNDVAITGASLPMQIIDIFDRSEHYWGTEFVSGSAFLGQLKCDTDMLFREITNLDQHVAAEGNYFYKLPIDSRLARLRNTSTAANLTVEPDFDAAATWIGDFSGAEFPGTDWSAATGVGGADNNRIEKTRSTELSRQLYDASVDHATGVREFIIPYKSFSGIANLRKSFKGPDTKISLKLNPKTIATRLCMEGVAAKVDGWDLLSCDLYIPKIKYVDEVELALMQQPEPPLYTFPEFVFQRKFEAGAAVHNIPISNNNRLLTPQFVFVTFDAIQSKFITGDGIPKYLVNNYARPAQLSATQWFNNVKVYINGSPVGNPNGFRKDADGSYRTAYEAYCEIVGGHINGTVAPALDYKSFAKFAPFCYDLTKYQDQVHEMSNNEVHLEYEQEGDAVDHYVEIFTIREKSYTVDRITGVVNAIK